MKIMQRLLLLFIGINGAIMNADPKNSMTYRASLYIKWVRHTISDQERELLKKSMPTDCAIVMFIGAVFTGGTIVLLKYGPTSIKEWANIGQFFQQKTKANTAVKIIFEKDTQMSREVQDAFDQLNKAVHKKLNGMSVKVGDDTIWLGISDSHITCQIVAEKPNMQLIQEFCSYVADQQGLENKNLTVRIYEESKNGSDDRCRKYDYSRDTKQLVVDIAEIMQKT